MKILAIKNMQQHAPVLQSPPLLSLSTSLSNSAQFLLGQRSCGASSNNVDLKSGTQVFSQSTPKEVAEEICKHFKNCCLTTTESLNFIGLRLKVMRRQFVCC
uniref:Uncharacterized protein n=1 Tax=Arion vulgaris TaxID=1028688 RepID=A0A0B7A197_9EUPU